MPTIDISTESLLLNSSLYNPIPFTKDDIEPLFAFLFNMKQLQFDCYCTECAKEVTFKYNSRSRQESFPPPSYNLGWEDFYRRFMRYIEPVTLSFSCSRNSQHEYHFTVLTKNSELIKIGQYPSSADIDIDKIKKYKKVLTNDHRDFAKAIGLHAHGVGAGSFVYLRRIFENLVEEKHTQASTTNDWNEDEYQRVKMDDKIKMLKDYLPEFLVKNRSLYGILSKGIHELTEDECLNLFPPVQVAIELILDEKINLLERERKIKEASKFVADTSGKLKG